ncbi:hypothetical protein M5D96_007236 [Drosophila gunungcola]|uniref:Uncharacterized protein n=1 Tax=Drosophila gunungcola TaxID=103775 RepID=A0A9Q0BPC2_9MUSC|nr:hypothetical protein M5D96_007236 [Drosophila gunungcola]
MSITLDFSGKNLAKSKSVNLHYLPAKIDGDGEANVEEYFNNYTREATDLVPEGYRGLVIQETEKPINESSDRQLRLTGVFEEFTYWNYDKVPSNGDTYRQALLLADVADALSKPISEQDLEAEIARNKENTKESP